MSSKEGPRGGRDGGGGRRDTAAEDGAGRSQLGVRRGGKIPSSRALHPHLGLQAFGLSDSTCLAFEALVCGALRLSPFVMEANTLPISHICSDFLPSTVTREAHDQKENLHQLSMRRLGCKRDTRLFLVNPSPYIN